jgi:hypothetical protein
LGAKTGPANRNGARVGLINLGWCYAKPATDQAGIRCPKQAVLQRRLFAKPTPKSLKSFGQTRSEPNKIAVSICEPSGGHFGNSRPKPLKSLHRIPFETKRNGFFKK